MTEPVGVKTKQVVTTRTDCRMCNSGQLTKIWSFGTTPLANAYLKPKEVKQKEELRIPLDVYFCQDCHLVQLLAVVSQHVLFDNYYYVSSTSPSFINHFKDYAEQLIDRFKLGAKSLVVDVGSNDGILLKPLQQAGVRVLGIDPAENIVAQANKEGVPTIANYFTPETAQDITRKYGLANIIAANNVFAHTDYIDSFVQAAKLLLIDDGVFVFEVQYLGDLLTNNLFDIVYHEHVSYYSVHPLIKFFANREMEVFDVEQIPVHGGSIRVFVQKVGGSYKRASRLDRILMQENKQGLTTIAAYQDFATRVTENKKKLQALLGQFKAAGKKIVGYGAPAKATTLMHALGIDGSVLDFIVDDAPLKQGMLMPGTHVPIVTSERMYSENIDYCLILAWNFAEQIIEKHSRFTKQGGKFIVPVPEPKVL